MGKLMPGLPLKDEDRELSLSQVLDEDMATGARVRHEKWLAQTSIVKSSDVKRLRDFSKELQLAGCAQHCAANSDVGTAGVQGVPQRLHQLAARQGTGRQRRNPQCVRRCRAALCALSPPAAAITVLLCRAAAEKNRWLFRCLGACCVTIEWLCDGRSVSAYCTCVTFVWGSWNFTVATALW